MWCNRIVYLQKADQGTEEVAVEVTKTVRVIIPDISITKEVSHDTSKVGDDVIYSICIENTGDWDLEDIIVEDSLLGDVSSFFPDTLAVGEDFCWDFEYTVPEGADDPLLNVAEVWGTAAGFDPLIEGAVVYDDADVEVDLVHPALSIEKTANKEVAKLNSVIEYTVTVCNDGDVDLVVDVEDSLEGVLATGMTIPAGECEEFEYDYIVTQADVDGGILSNTASATATLPPDLDLDNVIGPVTATFEVMLITPRISITKTVDPDTAQIGDTVTYTICIENIGDYGLENIVVNDTLLGGPLAGFPDTLAVGESFCLDFDYEILEADVVDGKVVNTADVYANPIDMPNDITDEDSAEVMIEEREVVCETAWAFGNIENWSVPGTGRAWGWSNGPLEPGTYVRDVYTGAGLNDLSKGTHVGTVTIHIDGADSWVRYEIMDGMDCWFSELHLWVGETALPPSRRGYTAAPGQFNHNAYPDTDEYTFYFDVSGLSSVYVAAHAVVCCYQ
jgi:uncharacterized repeat protein (TIGR01451 family)